MRRNIPKEVLHYSEREEYKEWKQRRIVEYLEGAVFGLLVITLITLSFYLGSLAERYSVVSESVKSYKIYKGGLR